MITENGDMVITENTSGNLHDIDGKPVNKKGYLVNDNGDVIDNRASLVMFAKSALDTDGEIPSPHWEERYNFNPHDVTGHFEWGINGKPILSWDPSGVFKDKYGAPVNQHGRRVDPWGNIVNKYGWKTFDKSMLGSDGDIPELYNYNGDKYHIDDITGHLDKDPSGEIIISAK